MPNKRMSKDLVAAVFVYEREMNNARNSEITPAIKAHLSIYTSKYGDRRALIK